MDGNIAKLVLFQHSVYGDYQCEINSRLEWTPTVVIVRVCVEVRERNFWPKDGIIFWAKEKKRRERERGGTSFIAMPPRSSCPFKIACRDISTSYPSKLHAITGILDSTTMLPMLITSPYTASSSLDGYKFPCPVSLFFFFSFFYLSIRIRDRTRETRRMISKGCVQFSRRLIFSLPAVLIHLPSTTMKGSGVT